MDVSTLFLENRIFIHTIYLLIVVISCIIICCRFRKLYNQSTYKGFKYFSNSFLFYALGFIITYIGDWMPKFYPSTQIVIPLIKILIEYTLLMGGFFIVYSLLWKKLEETPIPFDRVLLLHILAVVIALIDYFQNSYVMYVVLLVLTAYGCFLTYNNYMESKHGFRGVFFLAMILNLIGWLAYFVAFFAFPFFPAILLYIYILTAAIFIIFLYGAMKAK